MSFGVLVILLAYGAACFGLGRVRHPANLKLSAVKAEIAKIEAGAYANVNSMVARLKALL